MRVACWRTWQSKTVLVLMHAEEGARLPSLPIFDEGALKKSKIQKQASEYAQGAFRLVKQSARMNWNWFANCMLRLCTDSLEPQVNADPQ
jgi:hypothetical protein